MRAAIFHGIARALEICQVDGPVPRPGGLILELLVDPLSMASQ